MRLVTYKGLSFAFLVALWAPHAVALSCKISKEPIDQFLKSEYRWADIVAVGTVVASKQFGPGNFKVEGIWKGPDLEYLEIVFAPNNGTRTVVFARHDGEEPDNYYPNYGFWCKPWYRRVGHDAVIAKTIELFGQPRVPDTSMPNLVFVSGVLVLLLALVGLSLAAMKLVALNKRSSSLRQRCWLHRTRADHAA
jgi:hypothetical protein